MSGALKDQASLAEDIDMDRVIADAEYRRSVISRLRRERLMKAQPPEDDDSTLDED